MRNKDFITSLENGMGKVVKHCILIAFSMLALFPILLIVVNAFKSRATIFKNPYMIPTSGTFDTTGFDTVFKRSNFILYYKNSIIVMLGTLLLILFLGSLVAYALSEYRFKGNNTLFLYFLVGMIIPIRLGSVGILKMMVALKLTNTLWVLIMVYTVAGMPLAIFILRQFFLQVPSSIKEAARIDGASEWNIYRVSLHLVKPAIATVAAFSIAPVWNDIWWPLILAPGDKVGTVTMGAQKFLGQYESDWNALLAALTMAMVPLVIVYVIFSKRIMSGIIDGAVKG